jgi:hypothetical protein
MSVLSPEAVSAILANTRDRGGAERNITKFVESNELAVDITAMPGNESKKVDSLYNSYSQNVRKLAAAALTDGKQFPNLKVVKSGEDEDGNERVIMVNLDLHAEMVEAQKAAAEAA